RSETLRDTYILIEGERWVFHLEVEVGKAGGQTNTTPSDRGDAGYVLRIKDVVTGSRVVSEERVLRLDPNETSVLVAEWNLTRGEIPRTLNVSVEADGRRFDRSVRLGRVPVRQRVYE
ncbi:MAG: hypothetical protein SV760_01125, partial [Halobacteria archaeon]|nr:hypothetical protein [Halobacteria archaeon]